MVAHSEALLAPSRLNLPVAENVDVMHNVSRLPMRHGLLSLCVKPALDL
jgi:hypothetical protein